MSKEHQGEKTENFTTVKADRCRGNRNSHITLQTQQKREKKRKIQSGLTRSEFGGGREVVGRSGLGPKGGEYRPVIRKFCLADSRGP